MFKIKGKIYMESSTMPAYTLMVVSHPVFLLTLGWDIY